jgi:hypothetical protein
MRKLKGAPATSTMDSQTLRTVIDGLFPRQQSLFYRRRYQNVTPEELFTTEDLENAIERIKLKKTASGPDNISIKIIWAIEKAQPGMLLAVFNLCLQTSTIPRKWKEA